MKKAAGTGTGGCEIEARGINYHIAVSTRSLKIWSRADDDQPSTEQPHINTGVRQVLRNVTCLARPGELLAVVGPSGAGKSTLLEILAGRLSPSLPPDLLLLDGAAAHSADLRRVSGYVTQRDVLFPLLTVRETLLFSARLRLGAANKGDMRVDALLDELTLRRVADTRVKDLSGGERRRVSIGVEAVHEPAVLILDEPTSGLDSASALQIVGALRAMAESRGRTVLLSIHQPGARIVKMFDSVLLLAAGSVLHHGTVDALRSLLAAAGLDLPPHVDAVEFAIDSVDALRMHHRQRGPLPPARKREGRWTLQQLFQLQKQQHLLRQEEEAMMPQQVVASNNNKNCNCWAREVWVLSQRFFKNVARTRQLFACRTVCMLVAGLALGSIFYDLGEDRVAERVGLFAFLLAFLPIFLQERDILAKETSSGAYRVSSYAVANALVFMPFQLALAVVFAAPVYWLAGLRPTAAAFGYFLLVIWLILYTANSVVVCFASAAPDFVVGNAAIQGVMGSFFLFSGYFITRSAMPRCWVFMHYLSLFKWPFEALLVNEFAGGDRCVLRALGECVATGDDLLRREGLGGGHLRWRNVGVMVAFMAAYRLLGYAVLRLRCSLALNKANPARRWGAPLLRC